MSAAAALAAATREDFEALDRADELARFRAEFELPAGVVYLDGNSLGPLSRRARERVLLTMDGEWREGLIRSWTDAGWIAMTQRTGDKIARLVGAAPGEVIAADSTSVNLYKVLSVALQAAGDRKVILSARGNFPTDLYIVEGLAAQLGAGHEPRMVDPEEDAIVAALATHGGETAALVLTHVDYVTGRMYDMARITAAARAAGVLTIWDLAHSTGAMALDLNGCGVDFAVGCGYKYLNGGPGAPAYLFVANRHQQAHSQPLSGWMGHADAFAFDPRYVPAGGVSRYLCGTPAILAMAALEASVEVMLEAPMAAIRRKSMALGDAFIALVEERCAGSGLALLSPRAAAMRGSQVSYSHGRSKGLMQAMRARGLIGDSREPDVLRFGFAPLYNSYTDLWDAVTIMKEVLGR